MIYLTNPTNEDLDYTFGGLSYTLNSKSKKKVSEAEGNHALNALGSRGLTRLEFDDEGKIINEEKNAADAIERNREFKIRQINIYNFRNEQRKASGQPYDVPTPTVKRYAAELGIDLLQPYTMAEGEKAEIAKLHKENDEKDNQLKEQGKAIEDLTKMITDMQKKMVVKPTMPNDMIICDICGEEVMAKMMKSHMHYKHKDKA